jgi:hypothetical protein
LGIGHYMVVEGAGVLTDAAGKPVGNEKHCLSPGEDARLVACRLLRKRQSAPAHRRSAALIVELRIRA